MGTQVSEAAVDEVTNAVVRHFGAFPEPSWVETATRLIKAHGSQAAAQLDPGETVEWVTPGLLHAHGKVWPGAILLVTPHRVLISATRGTLRAKAHASALHRGPETLAGVSYQLLPGTSRSLWMLDLRSEHDPVLFALPESTSAQAIAEATATAVAGDSDQARAAAPLFPADGTSPENPFAAARADLAPFTVQESTAALPAIPDIVTETPAVIRESPSVIPAQRQALDDVALLPPPDWYDDPLGAADLRYWDGSAWTEHTAS